MEIIQLNQQHQKEFEALIQIFYQVFEREDNPPASAYLNKILSNQHYLVLAAIEESRVIGGLSVYFLNTCYSEKPTAYIYDVGIHPDLQRRGVGRKLMQHLMLYCQQNGFADAYVEAESDDEDAIAFYRSLNFSAELQATHFTQNFL